MEDIAQMAAHIDPSALDDEAFARLLALAGMGGGAGVPESGAGINQILQSLPRSLTKAIVIHYMNDLFT